MLVTNIPEAKTNLISWDRGQVAMGAVWPLFNQRAVTLQLRPHNAKEKEKMILDPKADLSRKSNWFFLVTRPTTPKNVSKIHPQHFEYLLTDKQTSRQTETNDSLAKLTKGCNTYERTETLENKATNSRRKRDTNDRYSTTRSTRTYILTTTGHIYQHVYF